MPSRRFSTGWWYELAQALDDLAATYTEDTWYERNYARLVRGLANVSRWLGRFHAF